MLKQLRKPNPVKKALFQGLPELNSPIYSFGRVGAAKSTTLRTLCEKYHDMLGYKIIHLWGGDRHEQNFWCFPSNKTEYWNKVKKKLKLAEAGPKEYQVNMLCPVFSKHLPKKLPHHPPRVKSVLFTIPFDSLTPVDVQMVIGNLIEQSAANFKDVMEEITKNTKCAEIKYIVDKIVPKKSLLYREFLEPLLENRFLQSHNHNKNLDIIAELKDKETITVLNLDYVPKEFHLFIMNWFLEQMNDLVDENKIPGKNIVWIQETAEFFKVNDMSIVPERMKVFKSQLSQYVRMCRRGVFLFFEAQSASETKGLVSGGADVTIICNMTSENDIYEVTHQIYTDGWMKDSQRRSISALRPGQCYWVEKMKMVTKKYFFMPRTMFWEPGINFYHEWDKRDGNMLNTMDDVNLLNDEYKETKAILDAKDKEAELIKKHKEELQKQKDIEQDEKEEMIKAERELKLEKKRRELKEQILGTRRKKSKVIDEEDFAKDESADIPEQVKIKEVIADTLVPKDEVPIAPKLKIVTKQKVETEDCSNYLEGLI